MTDHLLNLLRGDGPLPGPGEPEWNRCAADLVKEGLSGVALTLLSRTKRLEQLPPSATGLLTADLNKVRVGQAVLFHRFAALAELLRGAGVVFIVHKGGALAPLVYERLEDRPMVDIDIVIRPRTWQQVREILVTGGYRLPQGAEEGFWLENYFNLSISSKEDPPAHFDLHWGLTQEGRYHIETEELFARAVPYDLGALHLLRLSDEDLLLSLFLHLAYHYFDAHLIWLYDMKRVIELWPIDWDLLFERAGRFGLQTVVAFNIAFLEKVFPQTVPRPVARRARLGPVRRGLAAPLFSASPRHLFRGEERRLNQFALGLLAIDRPFDAVRFATDKVGRSLKWAGRRPRRR